MQCPKGHVEMDEVRKLDVRKVATEVSVAGKHHKRPKRPKSLSDLFEISD